MALNGDRSEKIKPKQEPRIQRLASSLESFRLAIQISKRAVKINQNGLNVWRANKLQVMVHC